MISPNIGSTHVDIVADASAPMFEYQHKVHKKNLGATAGEQEYRSAPRPHISLHP